MGEWTNFCSRIINDTAKWVEGFGYAETNIPTMRINNMYPYTLEQTIKVTRHNKPKRRDPARKANRQ